MAPKSFSSSLKFWCFGSNGEAVEGWQVSGAVSRYHTGALDSKRGLLLWPAERNASIPREDWKTPAKLTIFSSWFLVEICISFPHSTFYLNTDLEKTYQPTFILDCKLTQIKLNNEAALLQSNASFLIQVLESLFFSPGVHPLLPTSLWCIRANEVCSFTSSILVIYCCITTNDPRI